MKHLREFISVTVLVAVLSVFVNGETIIKQFEVNEVNDVIKPYNGVDSKRSQIIFENVEYVRLECHSDHPVQWIYSGSGVPIMNTDISRAKSLSTTEILEEEEGDDQYVASVYIGPLKESHTGNYQCSRTDYFSVEPNLYVYVPGQELFTSTQGKNIRIDEGVTTVLIPCSVTHPSAQVSLYKLEGEKVMKPVTKSSDAITYDPRKGFHVDLKSLQEPEGRYLCEARYNDLVRDVEYAITRKVKKIAPANLRALRQRVEESCTGEFCKQCENHKDCPPAMNCYTDFKCRDPCTYSIRCGNEALCRVVENRPHCYCPSGFVGDANKECFTRDRFQRDP